MRRALIALTGGLLALHASAQEATGTVAHVRGGIVTIRAVTGGVPQPGDRLTIWDEVPGIGPVALRGAWIVKTVENGTVAAEPEGETGTVQPGQQARIKTRPVRTGGGAGQAHGGEKGGAGKGGTGKGGTGKGVGSSAPTSELWKAVEGGTDGALVKRLLARGASANAANESGFTVLMEASKSASVSVVEALLAAGAHVNARTKGGGTALMYAAVRGSDEICEFLKSRGGDPTVKDSKDRTARDYARANRHPGLLALLEPVPLDPQWTWVARSSSDGKVSIWVPPSYAAVESTDASTTLLVTTPEDHRGGRHVVRVSMYARTQGESLAQWRERLRSGAQGRFEQYKDLASGEAVVAADPALWFIYSYAWQSKAVTALEYAVFHGDSAFEVVFATLSEDYEGMRNEFGGILASIWFH